MNQLLQLIVMISFSASAIAAGPTSKMLRKPNQDASKPLILDCTKISSREGNKESQIFHFDRFEKTSVLYNSASDMAAGTNGLSSVASTSNRMTFVKSKTSQGVADEETNEFTRITNDADFTLLNAWKIKTTFRTSDIGSAHMSAGICFGNAQ